MLRCCLHTLCGMYASVSIYRVSCGSIRAEPIQGLDTLSARLRHSDFMSKMSEKMSENYKNLTWEDIRTIVLMADNVLESMEKKELLAFGQKFYYTAVLERVTEHKQQEDMKGVNQNREQ